MSKDKGYILLYRSIKDNWIWDDKPFNKASAWIDLLMSANHNGNKVLMGSELIEVERGSLITSQDKLQAKWGWGNTKLRSFLKLLEKDKMIELKSTNKQTTIKIVNYNVYQICQTDNKPLPNRYQTTTKPLPNTNNTLNTLNECKKKEEKEYKEKELQFDFAEKEKILDFVWLKPAEKEKLIQDFGSQSYNDLVERLDGYLTNHPEKRPGGKQQYFDHNKTIRNWMKKEPIKEEIKPKKPLSPYYDPYTLKDIS